MFLEGKSFVIRSKRNGMRGYWRHNQLGVFVLNRAPRSRMKEGTRVNWNSAMRRKMLSRLAGTKGGTCLSRTEEGNRRWKKDREEE